MACIRYRRRRWVLDYRDATGRRRWETYRTKREAEDALAQALPSSRERHYPVVSADVTVAEYAERWLALCSGLKPRSVDAYRDKLRLHILPGFGTLQLRRVHRGAVRKLLSEKLAAGLSPASVQLIHATFRALLAAAVEDDVIRANPATGIARALKLSASTADRSEKIKAFDRDQLEAFLAAAARKTPELHPLLYLMSRTGLRLGEALGLQWSDVAWKKGQIRIERGISTKGEVTPSPKSGHGRSVDLGQRAVEFLRALRPRALEAGLRKGRQANGEPAWLFPGEDGGPLKHQRVETAFKRILRAADLPGHFSPHCLRHTYASILLAEGVSPAYVQQQLGHARIELTVGTYGRWLRKKAPGALDHLETDDVGLLARGATGNAEHLQSGNVSRAAAADIGAKQPGVTLGRDREHPTSDSGRLDPNRPVAEGGEMVAAPSGVLEGDRTHSPQATENDEGYGDARPDPRDAPEGDETNGSFGKDPTSATPTTPNLH